MNLKVRNITLIVLIILFSSSSWAQTDTINQTNPENGRKLGYWIVLGSMSKEKGYSGEAKVEEGVYNNSRKQGVWKKYWPNGKLKSEIFYNRGRSTGSYTTYFKNGNVEEKGTMKNGLLYGDYQLFWENGKARQEKTFNELGVTEGKVELFYENGEKELVFNTVNGVEQGESTWFYENGDVKKKMAFNGGTPEKTEEFTRVNLPYKNPNTIVASNAPKIEGEFNAAARIKDGYGKTYNDDKSILMDGEFKSGKLFNGRHYIYDEYGLLDHIEEYRDGLYVGNGIIGKKDLF
jgi:antitoxin component YwqK of YwqJK toxin-antitoxin module